MPYRQLGSFSRRKPVWTYSVLDKNKCGLFSVLSDQIYAMRCLFVAVGLDTRFLVLPHWDNMSPHATPPSHIILTPSRLVMFRGPYFILSTMQAGTTPIFKVFGMTGPSTNRESNLQIFLVSARFPLYQAIVTFYDQQGLLRTYSSPGGS